MHRLVPLVIFSTLFASQAAAADDAVKKKIEDAKLAYKLVLVDYRQAVGTWFEKREAAAHKDGNKKVVDAIKVERKAFDEKGELPKGAPKTLQEKMVPARMALDTIYQEVVKGYVKASQDALAEAVEKDLKDFLKEVGADPKVSFAKASPPPVIPAAALKAKLAGRSSYDQKTGVLTLNYRFASKDEFNDFEFGDAKPKVISPAALWLQPKETAKHIVRFDTMTMSAVLGVKQMKGRVLGTTDGTYFSVGGANPDTLYLDVKHLGGQSVIVPGNVRSGSIRIGLMVTEKKASIHYASEQLTADIVQPVAGQLELSGGELGFSFAYLTISGKVNADWAATFFAE